MHTKQLFKQISNLKQTQEPDPKFHDYHKLVKMKKLLIDTQKKMFNRIRLFQKESQKIIKKKQIQLKVYEKLQTIKKDPIFMNRTRIRQNIKTSQGNRNRLKEAKSQQSFIKSPNKVQNDKIDDNLQKKEMIEKLNQLRLQNVKIIKQDHQRNKSTNILKKSQFNKEKNANQEKNFKVPTLQKENGKKQSQLSSSLLNKDKANLKNRSNPNIKNKEKNFLNFKNTWRSFIMQKKKLSLIGKKQLLITDFLQVDFRIYIQKIMNELKQKQGKFQSLLQIKQT